MVYTRFTGLADEDDPYLLQLCGIDQHRSLEGSRVAKKASRRLIAVISALLLVAALAAVPALAGPVEVTIWTPFGADINGQTLNGLIEEFNEAHPDIRVVHQNITGDMREQYILAVVGDVPPDIGWVAPSWFLTMYNEEILVPVEELAERDGIDTEQFWPAVWSDFLLGRQWGYPFEIGCQGLIYNRDRFAAAGLPDKGPETWDEFLEVAKKVTDPEKGWYGFHPSWPAYMTVQWIWRNKGRLLAEDQKTATFTDPRTVEALQWYVDLHTRHGVVGGSVPDGTAAMIVVHPGWYGYSKSFAFDVGTALPPIPKDGQRASLSYYKELVVFRTTPERQEAAWTFIKWLMQPERLADWCVTTGYLPVSRAALETKTYQDYLNANPAVLAWVDELNYVRHFPAVPGYGEMLGVFQQAIDQARQGENDAYSILSSLQDKAQAILNEAELEPPTK